MRCSPERSAVACWERSTWWRRKKRFSAKRRLSGFVVVGFVKALGHPRDDAAGVFVGQEDLTAVEGCQHSFDGGRFELAPVRVSEPLWSLQIFAGAVQTAAEVAAGDRQVLGREAERHRPTVGPRVIRSHEEGSSPCGQAPGRRQCAAGCRLSMSGSKIQRVVGASLIWWPSSHRLEGTSWRDEPSSLSPAARGSCSLHPGSARLHRRSSPERSAALPRSCASEQARVRPARRVEGASARWRWSSCGQVSVLKYGLKRCLCCLRRSCR